MTTLTSPAVTTAPVSPCIRHVMEPSNAVMEKMKRIVSTLIIVRVEI